MVATLFKIEQHQCVRARHTNCFPRACTHGGPSNDRQLKEGTMLQDFISLYREAIIEKTREMVAARLWPPPSTFELEHGIPLFLTQLSETLRTELAGVSRPDAIGPSATRHGAELFTAGFTVSQVVHDYGDVCQAVTELALSQKAPISTEEFHILNRCLDTAIAEAVTEYGRVTTTERDASELERLGQLVHELRALLNTSIMAFDIVKSGSVSVNGSTGAILGRSLIGLRNLVESTLADVRLSANQHQSERVSLTAFLENIAVAARLQAEYRNQVFVIDPIDPELEVDGDPQLLASAVTNLLNNAFKYTPAGGRILLRARSRRGHVSIEVEDQCGGIPGSTGDLFLPFGTRRGTDKTGLGLGLSIARKAVRSHGGDIRIENRPGTGCVFIIDVPVPAEAAPETPNAG